MGEVTSKNSQKRATEVLSAAPALNVADFSGASAKSHNPAHLRPRPRPRPDRVSPSGSRKEALMRKVEIGYGNIVELEERAGVGQRLTEAYSGKSCRRSCSPNFNLVREFPPGHLLLEF